MVWSWYQFFQLGALVMAVANVNGLKRFAIDTFIPLLAIVNFIETWGVNTPPPNYFVYNIYLLISSPLQWYLFEKMLALKRKERRAFRAVFVMSSALLVVNYLFVQKPLVFNSFSLLLVEVINILCSALVIFRLVLNDELNVAILKHPFFWINAGILLFSLVTLVLLGLQSFIQQNRIAIANKTMYRMLMPILNCILYSSFIYAFALCQFRKNT